MSMRYGIFIIGIVISFLVLSSYSSASDVMVLEASIFKLESNISIVSIQVPDHISFGNVIQGSKSNELKIYVNNTGTVDLSVTPNLVNLSEEIFNYTYFRSRKTSNGTAVPFTRIGEFSFDISESNDEYFYMTLDLTNYSETIDSDMIDHQAEIRFLAMSR